jgi:hypothetical protein
MKPLKIRKTPSISRRKIISMINLYEKYVDEEITSINPDGYIQSYYNNYVVNIHTNKVNKVYNDPE